MPSFDVFQSTAQPAPSEDAVALIGARFSDLTCAETLVVIGRASGTGYTRVATARIASTFGNGHDTGSVRLAAGGYHVLQVACRNGRKVALVGPSDEPGVIPWEGSGWSRSIASFALTKGRTADLGILQLTAVRPKGFEQPDERAVLIDLVIRDDASRARMIQSQPQLAAAGLTATPLGLSTDPPKVLSKCQLIADPAAEAAADQAQFTSGNTGSGTLGMLTRKDPPPVACNPIKGGTLPG